MFKFPFSQKSIKVLKTENEDHYYHLGAFYGFQFFGDNKERIMEYFEALINRAVPPGQTGSVITEKMGRITMKHIVRDGEYVGSFPCLHTDYILPFETKEIYEWNNKSNIEAHIKGKGKNTFGLTFFATDFSEKHKEYKRNAQLNMRVSGFIYSAKVVTELPERCSPDFTGYMPNPPAGSSCFAGFADILDIQKYDYEEISGYIFRIRLVKTEDDIDFFTVELFANAKNIQIEYPEVGMKIYASFWLQGRIEES